jgi:hypothetical protein
VGANFIPHHTIQKFSGFFKKSTKSERQHKYKKEQKDDLMAH